MACGYFQSYAIFFCLCDLHTKVVEKGGFLKRIIINNEKYDKKNISKMGFLMHHVLVKIIDVKSQFNRSSILCNVNLKERKILKKNITEIFFKNLLGGKMYRKGK